MENSNQKNIQEDLDIDEDVGLTNEELSQITDEIDFDEVDSLNEVEEAIPKEEIETINFDAESNQLGKEPVLEGKAKGGNKKLIEKKKSGKNDDVLNLSKNEIDNSEMGINEVESMKMKDNHPALFKKENDVIKLSDAEMNGIINKADGNEKLATKNDMKREKNARIAKNTSRKRNLFNKEIKDLFLFLDKQLAFIPKSKLINFIESKHYPAYLKLISSFKKD